MEDLTEDSGSSVDVPSDIPSVSNNWSAVAGPGVIESIRSLTDVPLGSGASSSTPEPLPDPPIVRNDPPGKPLEKPATLVGPPPRDVTESPSSTVQHQPQQPVPISHAQPSATVSNTDAPPTRSLILPGGAPASDVGFGTRSTPDTRCDTGVPRSTIVHTDAARESGMAPHSLTDVPPGSGASSSTPEPLSDPPIVRASDLPGKPLERPANLARTPPRNVAGSPLSTTQYQYQPPAPVSHAQPLAPTSNTDPPPVRLSTPGEVSAIEVRHNHARSMPDPRGNSSTASVQSHDNEAPSQRFPGHFPTCAISLIPYS